MQTQRASGRRAGAEERSVGCFSTDERTVDSGHDADANVTRARRDGGPTPPPASPSQLQLSLVSASSPAQPRSISRFPLIRGDRLNPSHRWPRRPAARQHGRPHGRSVSFRSRGSAGDGPGRPAGVQRPPPSTSILPANPVHGERQSRLGIDETFSSCRSSSSSTGCDPRLHPHL